MIFNNIKDYYHNLNLDNSKAYQSIIKYAEEHMHEFSFGNNTLLNIKSKSKLHTLIAEKFEPVLFSDIPFFFEMGLKSGFSWGGGYNPVKNKQTEKFMKTESFSEAFSDLACLCAQIGGNRKDNPGLYRSPTPGFDTDHNSIGYTKIFEIGISGILNNAREKKKDFPENSNEYSFLCAVEESLLAVLKIADKFADAAKESISLCENETQLRYMNMIADAAQNVPKNPPRSFYEGLCTIWFLREVTGSLEGIGISVFGHMDVLLGKLYENDIEKGILTKEEAKELIRLWLIPTDIKFNCIENAWPETSSCIALGGCDRDGNQVFNDVTKMIIEAHHEMHLVAPKLNLRYSKNSPEEYLNLISSKVLAGHNNFALSCDDIVIESLKKCGYETEEARCYLNGGCQETMVEGAGHTAGAYFYVLLPAILDMSLNKSDAKNIKDSKYVREAIPDVIENASDFEEFYGKFLENAKKLITKAAECHVILGNEQKNINPCPLFSSMHEGCIENGKDYTEGGAKHNISTICLCGIGTLADSLYSIKNIVYDQKKLTLKEFAGILLNNWEGNEELRRECIHLPKYGHGMKEPDEIAKRFLSDIDECIRTIKNERGGYNITSMFTYYLFKSFSKYIGATADGRMDGDYLSQGIAASRLTACDSLTDVFTTVKNVGYTGLSGISVLDITLTPDIDCQRLTAFIKAAADCGCPNLQINCLSYEELKDAKINPEKHRNLIVRVAGLSVYFVNLEESTQDEIICRNFSGVK